MTTLEEQRRHASAASGGRSSGPIYGLFLRTLQELGLSGRVLDFGAGRGALTRELTMFDEVVSTDLMDRPEDVHTTWHAQDLNAPTTFDDQSFDVIVSAEVIEHLENPRAVAREWFRLLRPGGTVLFSTPNNESLRALVSLFFRGHFVEFRDSAYPAHITALVRTDMQRICLEAGFEAPTFRYTDHGAVPGLVRYRWQRLSGGLLRGRRFSDNVMAIARRPS